MSKLVETLNEYGAWRTHLSRELMHFGVWLGDNELLEAHIDQRIERMLSHLADDKLSLAFVAEYSRGKSELINAIFFGNFKGRVLPSSAGRTTMCPTELRYDSIAATGIKLLPIETRKQAGTISDLKHDDELWTFVPFDPESQESMASAFKHVIATKMVPWREAVDLGLAEEPESRDLVRGLEDTEVEISRWRHAVVNFPHPLLMQGLVILDTPGLNAIGSEPELTLNLIPNAHAVLFVLAADAGVTKSDIEVWQEHIHQNGAGARLVVLNKIDGLWDPLKSDAEINAEIDRQVKTSAELLHVQPDMVFPVSAQKALVAKVKNDEDLLEKSRIRVLESTLADRLIPSKCDIVRDQLASEIMEVVKELSGNLSRKKRGINEQLFEMRGLRGKNQNVVKHMMERVNIEKEEFERAVEKLQAVRNVFKKLSDQMVDTLCLKSLLREVTDTRKQMDASHFSTQLLTHMDQFFVLMRNLLDQAGIKSKEIDEMMGAMYRRFAADHGLSFTSPMTFTLDPYYEEVRRLEKAYRRRFDAITLVTTNKAMVIRKFFESVASRMRDIFDRARNDAETWLKAIMTPLENQVRDHKVQLKRRIESITRILDATGSLEGSIKQLEGIFQEFEQRGQQLADYHGRIATVLSNSGGAGNQLAA